MPRCRDWLAVGLLLLVACSSPEPLEGVDLPPASLPDEIDPAQWAVAYAHHFPAGFWGEGPHAYQLFLDCPELEEGSVQSEVNLFASGRDFPSFDDPVRLRIGGLSTTAMGPTDLSFVSTDQETVALITVVGLGRAQVDEASQCTGDVFWDEGESALLEPGEPFRP